MSSSDFNLVHLKSSSVSLLTEATSSLSNSGNTIEEKLSNIEVYKNLSEYEDSLVKLIESVDKFRPDLEYAKLLIRADHNLFDSLDKFSEYDKIDTKLKKLENESREIDQKTKEILESLNECHDNLNTLPTLEQVEFEMDTILSQREKINSTILLDYATKLSKFTKIPPTFDKGSIGPNNFVWPGDDALRRGMLAMASLNSDKLTKIPGQDDDEEVTAEIPNEYDENKTTTTKNEGSEPVEEAARRQSFVFSGNDKTEEKKEENSENDLDLDLDLFNPDEF